MKFILGKKEKMTQYFTEEGVCIPATWVSAGPMFVTQVKNKETDGYSAVQFGYEDQKKERINKPKAGHLKEIGNFKHLKEFKVAEEDLKNFKNGDKIDATTFEVGNIIEVRGESKGRGFQGVVKRHGFHGGPRSHGQKHSEREPGSIGGGLRNRVPKGMRMGGRMGGETIKQKNLVVLAIDQENSLMLLKGAIPGRKGTLVEIVSKK